MGNLGECGKKCIRLWFRTPFCGNSCEFCFQFEVKERKKWNQSIYPLFYTNHINHTSTEELCYYQQHSQHSERQHRKLPQLTPFGKYNVLETHSRKEKAQTGFVKLHVHFYWLHSGNRFLLTSCSQTHTFARTHTHSSTEEKVIIAHTMKTNDSFCILCENVVPGLPVYQDVWRSAINQAKSYTYT